MSESSYEVHPIGRVESPLVDPAPAPKQGYEGSPDAVLVFHSDMHAGAMTAGRRLSEIVEFPSRLQFMLRQGCGERSLAGRAASAA